MVRLVGLPTEILLDTIRVIQLTSFRTLPSLVRVNKALYTLTTTILYESIHISNLTFDAGSYETTCRLVKFCDTVLSKPELAALVRNVCFEGFERVTIPDKQRPNVQGHLSQMAASKLLKMLAWTFSPDTYSDSELTLYRWYKSLLINQATDALAVFTLAHLPGLRRLAIDLYYIGDFQVWSYMAELISYGKCSLEGTNGFFSNLEYLSIEGKVPPFDSIPIRKMAFRLLYRYTNEKANDTRPLTYFLGLPSLKHIEACFMGDRDFDRDGEAFRLLRPGSANVSKLELNRSCQLSRLHLSHLLKACKKLREFRYDFVNPHAAKSCNAHHLQPALLSHRESLQNLNLSHEETMRPFSKHVTIEAIDLSQFEQLRVVEMSANFLLGRHDLVLHTNETDHHDDVPETTEHYLHKHMPRSLEELTVLQIAGKNAMRRLDMALINIIKHKETKFERWKLIRIKTGLRSHQGLSGVYTQERLDNAELLNDSFAFAAENGITTKPVAYIDGRLEQVSNELFYDCFDCRLKNLFGSLNIREQVAQEQLEELRGLRISGR